MRISITIIVIIISVIIIIILSSSSSSSSDPLILSYLPVSSHVIIFRISASSDSSTMLLKPIAYPLLSRLQYKLELPADLLDCIVNMVKWQGIFGDHCGIILLVIGLKFPIARAYFVDGYVAAKTTPEAHRVYLGCVAMVLQFGDPEKYRQLAEEIDSIKGPLYCHGILIFMRRIGIVATSRNSEGIRLGLGSPLVNVVPYNANIAKKIASFLRMSPVLSGLQSAWNLKKYGQNLLIVSKAMTRLSVPQMATNGYNKEWSFRSWQVATNRANGLQRLKYEVSDTVSMLPGPDGKNARRSLNPKLKVADLYKHHGITTLPEYICLAACLRSGKYKENRSNRCASRISGRCSHCVRQKKSRHYCRILHKHTRPTLLRATAQVLKAQKRKPAEREVKKRLRIPGRCSTCITNKRTQYQCRVDYSHTELAAYKRTPYQCRVVFPQN